MRGYVFHASHGRKTPRPDRLSAPDPAYHSPTLPDDLYFHRLVSALGPNEHGLNDAEVREVEERYGFTFPPDLRALLQYCLPISLGAWPFPNWRVDSQHLRDQLSAPLDGLLFDIEHNGAWLPDLGERPSDPDAARELALAFYARQPRLIPIFSHRYLPAEPCEEGNPVFSVMQTHIIYYGLDLQDYFRNEFHLPLPAPGPREPRNIKFWSNLVKTH